MERGTGAAWAVKLRHGTGVPPVLNWTKAPGQRAFAEQQLFQHGRGARATRERSPTPARWNQLQLAAMPDSTVRRRELYRLLGDLPPRDRPVKATHLHQEDVDSYELHNLSLDLNGIEAVPAYFAKPIGAK